MSKYQIPVIDDLVFGNTTVAVDHLLTTEYDEVGDASREIPATVEYLNQMLQYFTSAELVEKAAINAAEAKAYMELRNGTFADKYGDKMTEKALEHAVNLDERVAKAVADHAESEAWVDRLRGTIRVLLARMEFIRTVEATRRHADQTTALR